jgi:hypothetical protein
MISSIPDLISRGYRVVGYKLTLVIASRLSMLPPKVKNSIAK